MIVSVLLGLLAMVWGVVLMAVCITLSGIMYIVVGLIWLGGIIADLLTGKINVRKLKNDVYGNDVDKNRL
jgi:hypothetical protein